MKKESYVAENLSDEILSDIKNKYFNESTENYNNLWNARALNLMYIKIRLIKYYGSDYKIQNATDFIKHLNNINIKPYLSEEENKRFDYIKNFLIGLPKQSQDEQYGYIVMQLIPFFNEEKINIYKKIVILEEKKRIKELLENF